MRQKNVTIIVGGQYGSEGKGKVAGYIAQEFDIAVRVGGPNAGHTVWVGDTEYKLRQIPVAGLVNPDLVMCIGAGGLINLNVLWEELPWVKNLDGRLIIDRNAGIVEPQDIEAEGAAKMFEAIGSTSKGVGSSLSRKLKRQNYRTAKDVEYLEPYIGDVQEYLFNSENAVMLEGTQGYALSLNHGPYPFCTSRDVLATSILSDVGLSPFCVKDVILVIRTYPIRVFGNSGPMFEEVSWEDVSRFAGTTEPIVERTTVTNRVRRVGKFDWKLLSDAARANQPTQIALMFADYLDHKSIFGTSELNTLDSKLMDFIEEIETVTETPVTLIGTGPKHNQMIDRRAFYGLV